LRQNQGDVLDILVLKHRSAKAPKRFLKRLTARYGQPRVIVRWPR